MTERLLVHDFVRGAVILSTCNRIEVYLDLDEPLTQSRALGHQLTLTALSEAPELSESAESLAGDDVVRHLFSVSSGLESMVIGEDEITGQVQRALTDARTRGSVTSTLERAFQKAAHATRTVRAHGDMAAAGRSLARLALEMIEPRVPDWAHARILLVGTGQYAATTIAALRARGAEDIRVYSATGRAQRFAAKYSVHAEDELSPAIASAEIVITCTARYTIVASDVTDAAPRIIVDLGLPRNVDPAVGLLPGVDLLDLDIIGRHANVPELSAGATAIVGSAAASFAAEQAASPAIVAARAYVRGILDSEVARAGENPAVASALRHFAGVFAHDLSARARAAAADGDIAGFSAAIEKALGVTVGDALHIVDDRAAG